MARRDIRIWPDPILSSPTVAVAHVDDEVRALIADLFETMYDAEGIGLAANQVGVARQVLVIDLDPDRTAADDPEAQEELAQWGFAGPIALINPEITARRGEIVWDEGCLSVPGVTDLVTRSAEVEVRYLDEAGATKALTARGLFAVCIQHEMDHLAGRVFVEYLSKLKQGSARRRMLRLKGAVAPRRQHAS